MLLTDWLRLLARNRFRVHPLRWGLAGTVTGLTIFNSCMRWLERVRFERRASATPMENPPVFIVGHWRSGTTYLHELMSLDDRYAWPTSYQCFAANHFLLTGWFMPRLFWCILPSKRPMDNVVTGWRQPQEDEFALCAMGVPSPYLRMAFPNEPHEYLEYLDLEGLSPEELRRWEQALLRFVRRLTLLSPKPLILKSPTHTGRLSVLARMFPGARFVHIVRDPRAIFASTLNLWQTLDEAQGLQVPRHQGLEGYIFRAFERMYGGFQRQRDQLAPNQICDVRYEDLVREPVDQMARIYETLQLGDFQLVRDRVEQFAQGKRSYQTNRHELPAHVLGELQHRWQDYFERYGYVA